MTGYMAKALQLESATQQQKQARDSLCEHIDKLCEQLTSAIKQK